MNWLKTIRTFIIHTLAISMIIVFWVFVLDAFYHGLWRNLSVILSILLFAIATQLLFFLLHIVFDSHPVLTFLLEYILLVIIFFAFARIFNWFEQITWWMTAVYTIPVYLVTYLLRLIGAKKDADYINEHLETLHKKRS